MALLVRGGRGGDEGLARTHVRYLRKTWRNRGKNEVRPGVWHLRILRRSELEQMAAHGDCDGFGSIGRSEFCEHSPDVLLDRIQGDAQLF